MKQFKNLKEFTPVAKKISFQIEDNKPYILFYYPENTLLLESYPSLNLRYIDFKTVIIPITKIPRTRLTGNIKNIFRQYKIYAYSTNQKYPENRNLIFDYSTYFGAIDETYKPTNYRQRAGFLLRNILYMTSNNFPSKYTKILLYHIQVEKSFNPSFMNRKSFPLIQQIKEGNFPFDNLLLCISKGDDSTYRLLSTDKKKVVRNIQYLRDIKVVSVEEEEEKEIETATKDIINKVDVSPENKSKVDNAVTSYLSVAKDDMEKVITGKASKDDKERIAVASLLYKTSGDLIKSRKIASSIPVSKRIFALKTINKSLVDEILEPKQSENLTSDIFVKSTNIQKVVDEKTPEHIFEKREIDYKINLKKDMTNAFKMLENKEVPLKVTNIKIIEKVDRPGEIDPTDKSTITISLQDKNGKVHNVEIDVPKIDPKTGTFRVYGQKKCLINQIIQCPITFPKPYESRFESSYSKFRIWIVQSKRMKYLHSYMGGCKIPLLIMLSYSFGFENILKNYGLDYILSENKPNKDDKFVIKIDDRYIYFTKVDTPLKEYLVNSFIYAKPSQYKIDYEFGSKMYFNELIIAITGRINSTYLIQSNIENIVTPVAHQILLNQQLPTKLDQIMKYMAMGCIEGKEIKRNDLSNQRIRNSEVIVDLAQSRILAAYTEYKEQILSGNKDAIFNIPKGVILADFNKIENVSTMEYANPIEEMATLSRVTPVGKTVGGIPDKRAITTDALNVHPTYFGNIDLYDTPEGENIGVVQQLTVDAHITSARGLFQPIPISNKENAGLLSTTTSMIPFVSHNDGNRIMMAASQAKQMLPLKNPEPPIVQSGYESLLTNVLSDSFIKKAPCTGKIYAITHDSISLTCSKGNEKHIIDITPVHLKSGMGKNTLSVFNPTVIKGENIKEGQIIAEGSGISGGTISLGRTLLAAVMPYRGYNYEDGITISDRLVREDKLTSLHGIIEEISLSENDRLLHIASIGDKTKKGDIILRKTVGEIEELIGFDEEEESTDILAGQLIKKSPGGTIVDIEVFSNIKDDKFPKLKALIARTRKRYKNPTKNFSIRGQAIKGVLIKFKIEQELMIGLGDKLANRHGNKGIISLIEEEKNMPRTPWGENVDIVLNPLGIIGRMNVGQIYELYCGLIGKELANRILASKSKSDVINLFKNVMTILDNTKNKKFSSYLINNLKGLNRANYELMIEQIRKSGFAPIVVPPFQTPTYKNILTVMKLLNLKEGYNLYLPNYSTKTNYLVPLGYMYMTKLEHMGESKIHARATGPLVSKTLQPTGGKSREGGQRLGEMDTYSFLSYNATITLSELMGPLSDDRVTQNEMISEIIQTGEVEFKPTKTSPVKDLLNAYMIGLMLGK